VNRISSSESCGAKQSSVKKLQKCMSDELTAMGAHDIVDTKSIVRKEKTMACKSGSKASTCGTKKTTAKKKKK
jgi:hypothetical protein